MTCNILVDGARDSVLFKYACHSGSAERLAELDLSWHPDDGFLWLCSPLQVRAL